MVNVAGGGYERIRETGWLGSTIAAVEEQVNPKRKYKDKNDGQWKTRSVVEIRFAFSVDGYRFRHTTRWMTKSVNKQSRLYDAYLKMLCPELEPDTPIDLDRFVGKRVRTKWIIEKDENGKEWERLDGLEPDEPIHASMLTVDDMPMESKGGTELPEGDYPW